MQWPSGFYAAVQIQMFSRTGLSVKASDVITAQALARSQPNRQSGQLSLWPTKALYLTTDPDLMD